MQPSCDMQWWKVGIAFACSTVCKVQVEVGCPCGVIFPVESNNIAAAGEIGSSGVFRLHPCVAWVGEIFPQYGTVYHDREYVAALAFLNSRFCEEIVMVVANIWNFDIVRAELNFVAFAVVDLVLEVTAAPDFPAVVDIAGGEPADGDCVGEGRDF